MARINLLPWREGLRKQRQRDFAAAVLVAILVTVGILFYVHAHIEGLIEHQEQRNRFLENEIAALDNKIAEIKKLEDRKAMLLAKMDVIQQLQKSRPEIVHLFEEIAKTVPDGVYLTQFSQSGSSLTFRGKAQSNARVSAYMHSIEASGWMKNPNLNIILSKDKADNVRLSDFTMFAEQGPGKPREQAEGGA